MIQNTARKKIREKNALNPHLSIRASRWRQGTVCDLRKRRFLRVRWERFEMVYPWVIDVMNRHTDAGGIGSRNRLDSPSTPFTLTPLPDGVDANQFPRSNRTQHSTKPFSPDYPFPVLNPPTTHPLPAIWHRIMKQLNLIPTIIKGWLLDFCDIFRTSQKRILITFYSLVVTPLVLYESEWSMLTKLIRMYFP